jgi:putative exporter of polyketide antibiotics
MSALALYGVPGKMTRRLAGVVIGTQGLVVFFGALVARALAAAHGSHTSSSFLLVGAVLAVLCLLDTGLLRQPWGITLGWVLQIATLACAFIVPLMLLVGLLFGALWLTALVQGQTMDEHTRRVDAQWHAEQEKSRSQRATPKESPQDR